MSVKRNVLIAISEISILDTIKQILELSGDYEVISAFDGREALKRIRDMQIDLAIVDRHLPEIDGVRFCKRLRNYELTKNIPLIMYVDQREDMIEGLQAGADDFIFKNPVVDEVIVKIEALFRRIKNTQEQAYQLKGSLEEYTFDDLLAMAHRKGVTGEMAIQKGNEHATVSLHLGDIKDIHYKDFAQDEALDELRKWQRGLFIIRTVENVFEEERKTKKTIDKNKTLYDENHAISINDNVWWVGARDAENQSLCNSYLCRFENEGQKISMLIHPGSPLFFKTISDKVAQIVENIAKINVYTVLDAGPDSAMNILFLRNTNNRAVCLTTDENWSWIKHYGLSVERTRFTSRFKNFRMTLTTGHRLTIVPAAYTPYPGSFMLYEPEQRILFSGQLFSSFTDVRDGDPYTHEADWSAMRDFHARMMPYKHRMIHALEAVQNLDPEPMIIAPLYGRWISGKQRIERIIHRLKYIKIEAEELDGQARGQLKTYRKVMNEILESAQSYIEYDTITKRLMDNPVVMALCRLNEQQIEAIFDQPQYVFEEMVNSLIEGESPSARNHIKSEAFQLCHNYGLPAPSFSWDMDQTLSEIPKSLFNEEEDTAI
ncbi:MAG: response regulator [Caldithrix sp.]|nr:response regulator [Caldithrix sp.]